MSTTSRNPDDSNPDFTPSQRRGVVPPGPPSGATGGDAADLHPDLARRKGIRRTRTGALWTALVTGVLILLLLLVFILQNLDSITLELFGWDFSLPLGVALLFAAIAGAAIVGIAGGLRILQLRHAANRQRALSTDPGGPTDGATTLRMTSTSFVLQSPTAIFRTNTTPRDPGRRPAGSRHLGNVQVRDGQFELAGIEHFGARLADHTLPDAVETFPVAFHRLGAVERQRRHPRDRQDDRASDWRCRSPPVPPSEAARPSSTGPLRGPWRPDRS